MSFLDSLRGKTLFVGREETTIRIVAWYLAYGNHIIFFPQEMAFSYNECEKLLMGGIIGPFRIKNAADI